MTSAEYIILKQMLYLTSSKDGRSLIWLNLTYSTSALGKRKHLEIIKDCRQTNAERLKTESQEFSYFQEKSLKCLELKANAQVVTQNENVDYCGRKLLKTSPLAFRKKAYFS